MKLHYLIFITLIYSIIAGCSEKASKTTIYDLRCENLTEPAGIGTTLPALSWKLRSEAEGAMQNACQILVASKPALLTEESADLWNSGKIQSSSGVLLPYHGKDLTSRSVCYWKVRIWDERNRVTEWSQAAGFSIGLLGKSDWNASYIGLPAKENVSVSPQLKKSFEIKSKGEKIFLYVNSLGYHEVFLNGQKAGDKVLTPAVTQFSKRSRVVTYDITSMVKEGRNDVVLWLGHGWYSKGLPGVVSDRPVVMAQAEQLKDGKWEKIVSTDSTWSGRNSGYSYLGTWRSGE